MSGWVIVRGRPSRAAPGRSARRCRSSRARCRTGPRRRACRSAWAASATSISAMRLLAPITLDGRTALSVETKTNRSTPAATAASSSASVPPMLTWTASDGCSSIIGTCLYAAAWKMTSGRSDGDQTIHRAAAGDVGEVDVELTAALAVLAAYSSSRWMRYSALSARSTSTSRLGPIAKTWRASSDPIEPPAPVISTVRSRDDLLDRGRMLLSRSAGGAGPRPGRGGSIGVELPSRSSLIDGNGADLETRVMAARRRAGRPRRGRSAS